MGLIPIWLGPWVQRQARTYIPACDGNACRRCTHCVEPQASGYGAERTSPERLVASSRLCLSSTTHRQ